MNKNIKVALVAIVALVSSINVFSVWESEPLSKAVSDNVEALAFIESDDEYTPGKFCTMHIRCFNQNGSTTGQCRADAYMGDACTHTVPHSHGCSNCCYY